MREWGEGGGRRVVVVDACGSWVVSVDGVQAVNGERVRFVVGARNL